MLQRLMTILALFFGMFLCLNAHAQDSQQQEDDKLVIALARIVITPAEEVFAYAVPKQLGYFADEKLDVKILPTNGSTAALQTVANGSADIAFASSTNIATAISKGVPLKAFAGLTVRWPYFIAVPQNSDIKTIADLKGKRIGVVSLASASYSDLKANLKFAGLSEDDVKIIPIGAGPSAAVAIKTGEVDAIDSYSDSFTSMRQNGIDLRLLERPTEIEDLFSVTMVTSEKTLKEKPEQLAAFARAAYKGIIYTKLEPESALKLAFTEFPQLSGANMPESDKAKNTFEVMMTALNDSIPADQDNPMEWGEWLNIPVERWNTLLSFADETGLTKKHLSVEQVWDGSLMPKIYNFDITKMIKK